MPSFEHDGAHIYYEEFGQGFPILTFAPAGLQSVIEVWSQPSAPINPTTEFADKFRVIAMDQRNAGGRSRAPISAQDGWDSYTADHIALLDHLRIDRCHLYGQCIGGSFILNLHQESARARPERRAGAADRPRRPDGARPPRPVQRLGGNPQGPSGGHPASARCVLPEPLRRRFRLLRRPRLREDGPHPMSRTRRQRRGAPVPDLRGALEAAPELRIHPGVESRRGADRGEGAGRRNSWQSTRRPGHSSLSGMGRF